ncbi:hypothetical protein WJX72_006773 [[Myrmecia] bisecta]|uniref:chorismate mutase n=1 Tax=[Myrmecia] bisecta TaxID=41462 RepID=A0AAW1PLQ6_9CHLO
MSHTASTGPCTFQHRGTWSSQLQRRTAAASAVGRWQQWQSCSSHPPRGTQLSAAGATVAASTIRAPAVERSDSVDLSSSLSLDNIRQALIRQEDTIIFSLIERAQFAANDLVYQPDGIPVPGYGQDGRRYSLLEYLLRETEQIHGKIRRYTSPDEHAFYPDDTPALALPPITYPQVLAPCAKQININDQIMDLYLQHLLPGITQPGDDNNYGSAAMYDVLCLQALSKRIHYGKFVAEAKFRARREQYTELISKRDEDQIMQLLTDRTVEAKVVDRVRRKAAIKGGIS